MSPVLTHDARGQKTDPLSFLPEGLLDCPSLKPVQFDVQSRSQAFMKAWSKGVHFVGKEWFVDDHWKAVAATAEDCLPVPNILELNDALNTMGGAKRLFFSLMVSLYSPNEGKAMLKYCGFRGLADLACLDVERRQIISDLIMHCSV